MPTPPDKLEELLSVYSVPMLAKDRPLHPKSLLYGKPKIGKTITACRVGQRPLLFACDPGWSSIKDWPDLCERVTVDEMQSLKHFKLFVEALATDLPRYREFDHVIIDPTNKIVMQYIDFLQDNYKPSQADSRVHWQPIAGSKELTFTTAGMGDYQAVRNWIRRPVYQLTRLQKMVTFICHAQEPGFTESASAPVRAALPGKTYEMLAQEVDFIGYMEAKGTNITISLSPSEKEDAGSRIRALHGQKIKADDFPTAIEKWRNGELSVR